MSLFDPLYDPSIFDPGLLFDDTPVGTLSWVIGAVTLPHAPSNIRLQNPAVVNKFAIDGAYPFLVSDGLKTRTLTIQGEIYGKGTLAPALWAGWVNPLGGLLGKDCAIQFPDSRYDGTWLCASVDFEEVGEGGQAKFNYAITFKMGTEHVIL